MLMEPKMKFTRKQQDRIYKMIGMTREQFEKEKPWKKYGVTRDEFEQRYFYKSHEYYPDICDPDVCKDCRYRNFRGYDFGGREIGWRDRSCKKYTEKPQAIRENTEPCKYFEE